MKQATIKYMLLFAAMFSGITSHAEKIFEALASNPHVESVYVGKAMMSMARGFLNADNSSETKSALNAVKDIDSIEIISCEKASAIPSLKEQARKILGKLKLEMLLETKEGDESTIIYGCTPSDNNNATVSGMVIESSEPGEYSLIHISGTIDIKSLTEFSDSQSCKK